LLVHHVVCSVEWWLKRQDACSEPVFLPRDAL